MFKTESWETLVPSAMEICQVTIVKCGEKHLVYLDEDLEYTLGEEDLTLEMFVQIMKDAGLRVICVPPPR